MIALLAAVSIYADIAGYTVSKPALDAEVHPRLVAAAPDDNVWFYQESATPHSIGFFTPAGHVTTFTIPCSRCATGEEIMIAWDLAADRDGSVWFIANHAKPDTTSIDSTIGHLTTAGEFRFFAIPTSNATAVVPNGFGHSSLAIAPDGTIWFTENAAYKAARLTPSTGAVLEYPLEMPEQPSGITIGADGKIWYTVAASEIAQITPPANNGAYVEFGLAGGSYPFGLATGADGNVWVTETGRNKIGRIQGNGIISEFTPPTTNGAPQHIVAAPDGTLWYAEGPGMAVGRLTLNGAAAPKFEVASTPGTENFDITASARAVYVTGREVASGQDTLLKVSAACTNGPVIAGPSVFYVTRSFSGVINISGGSDPLTVTIQSLPASWSAQTGRVTLIDSGAAPPLGTYPFTISVVDADGCSASQQITVNIVNDRRRSAKH